MRGPLGCLAKLILLVVGGAAFAWVVMAALNPWALHIGGRPTPLLYWHGMGAVIARNGTMHPLYVRFWPGRPHRHGVIGRREGKIINADLTGAGWLCVAPGNAERMQLSGTVYGGYASTTDSLFDFRLLEWRKAFSVNYQKRGFFDLAGTWQGPDLVMNRPHEQSAPFQSGLLIDHATVTLHWASYGEFEAVCRNEANAVMQPK